MCNIWVLNPKIMGKPPQIIHLFMGLEPLFSPSVLTTKAGGDLELINRMVGCAFARCYPQIDSWLEKSDVGQCRHCSDRVCRYKYIHMYNYVYIIFICSFYIDIDD